MPIQPNDLFLLQRGTDLFKTEYSELTQGFEGGALVTISETAPADPSEGDLWWADTDVDEGGGRLYIYTGDEWVDTSLPGFSGDYDDLINKPVGEYLRIDADAPDQTVQAGKVTFKEGIDVRQGAEIQTKIQGYNTGQFSQTDLLLIGGRNSGDSGYGQIQFQNHRNIVQADRKDNAVTGASIRGYSATNDVTTNGAGGLLFRTRPVGFQGDGVTLRELENRIRIDQNGKVTVYQQLNLDAIKDASFLGTDADGNVISVAGGSNTQADSLKANSFDGNNNRPITCFKSRVDTAGENPTYDSVAWAATNTPLINGGTGQIIANGGFNGDLTGNVTGDLTGIASKVATTTTGNTRPILLGSGNNITDTSKSVQLPSSENYPKVNGGSGNLTALGGFTGDLTGNVTGDVTGNATSANKVQQTSANNNQERNILLKNNTDTNDEKNAVRFSTLGPTVQTSTGRFTVASAKITGSSVTNSQNIGLYISTVSNSGNNYAIYTSTNAKNYFHGQTGIRINRAPEADLHVAGSVRFDRSSTTDSQNIQFRLDDTANRIEAFTNTTNTKDLKITNTSPERGIVFQTTFSTSQTYQDRVIIEKSGLVKILNLANNGTGYVKVNNAGSLSFSATRTVAAGEVEVQMDSDDPASFQTTYVTETDPEGDEYQLAQQQYVGTTEDLLSIIKDLRARLAAIESNEVVDDATDSALLTLVSDLATRVTQLETEASTNG